MSAVPSNGGWIKFQNIPMHLWNKGVFMALGELCGGLLENADKKSSLIECLEEAINVEGNYCGQAC